MNITAAEILDSKVYRQAESAAKQRILNEWATCKQEVRREALWHVLQALNEGVSRELRAIRDAEHMNARED